MASSNISGYRKRLGAYGEKLAAVWLIKKGYTITEKNFQTNCGEIDLIAQTGGELLFVEVKTRASAAFGFPELAVDCHKISHLSRAAQIYLERKNWRGPWRLDVISIEINKLKKTAKIRWLKDIGSQN